jgi:hypothetical protein
MNARRLAVLPLVALALLATGCGGDDGGDEAAATTDTAIVEDSSTGTTDDDGSTTSSDDSVGLEGECAEFAGLSARLSQALGGSTSDLNSATEVFDEVADQVPDEIRDDYEVLAANFKELAKALEGIDLSGDATPSAEDLAKLQGVSQSLDTPEVRQATENIEAWAAENC